MLVAVFSIAAVQSATDADAQSSDEALREVTAAFTTADAPRLTAVSTSTVDIALLGSSRPYSNRQATLIMRSFFREYPPESFRIEDFTKTGRGWFIEAEYRARDRVAPLRIYLRLRRGKTGWLVREVLIEEERE